MDDAMARKLTLLQIGSHDFYRAMRVARRDLQPLQLFERIMQERAKAQGTALKSLVFAVGGSLWLASAKADLTVKLTIFDLSLPAAYVNAAVAFAYAAFVFGMINYFVLNELARIIAHRMLKFDSAWALGTLYDGGSAWSLVWIGQFRHLMSSNRHKRIGIAIAVLSNLPVFIASAIVLWTVATVGMSTLANHGLQSLKSVMTLLAWLFVVMPFTIAALMLMRFTFVKNVNFIRWNVLVPLYRTTGRWPPQIDNWIRQMPRPDASQTTPKQ
jgi:hypothetical protein